MKDIYNKIKTILDRKQKVQLIWIGILVLGGALCELVGVSAIVPFIQSITAPEALLENDIIKVATRFIPIETNQQLVVGMAIMLIGVYVIKNIYLCIMTYHQHKFTFDNQYKLSQTMLEKYINCNYEYHLSHGSAELIRNIRDDAAGFYSFILCLIQLISEVMVCIVLAVFLMIQDLSVTITLVALLSVFVVIYAVGVKTYVRKLGQTERVQFELMNKWIMEGLGGIKETKILKRERHFAEAFKRETDELAKTKTKYSIVSYIPKPTVETLCISGLLLVVAIRVAQGTEVEHFVSIVSVFAIAAFRLLPSMNRITNYLSMLMFRKPCVDALYKDVTEIPQLPKDTQEKEQTLPFEQEVSIENVIFRYEGTQKDVLEHASLRIPKNKSVALIGPSGGGKTTLADILLGLLEPSEGSVCVDGVDIKDRKGAWYEKVGYIPQNIFLLDDTLKQNIAFGIPKDAIDEERLQYAMKEAQIKEFIDGLPEGLETQVGERGVKLSGGQRQRIGIARALYKNPDILIMDEATSALDNDTERAVMQAIDRLGGKKTLVIIAHRLSTIKNCDIIYKIENGKVTVQ